MRAFEIHTFKDGKWKMDSVFDDRELAIFEARKISEGSRYAGVKVVEENYDETTNLTTTRTLFRGGAAKAEKAKKPAEKETRARSHTGAGKDPTRRGGAKREKKQSNLLVPVLMLLTLLMSGVTMLFALQYFAGAS